MSSVTPALTAEAEAAVPPKAKEHVHLAPLDGVRGTAILLVLIGHIADSITSEFTSLSIPGVSLGRLGWVGVDLFFVLSGFLITGILYEAKGRDGYFKTFYARRALRIFPLYYTAIIVVFLLAAIFPTLYLLGEANPGWLLIYATNFVAAHGQRGGDAFGVLTHFWSLAVEEHFYLFWPTIVFFFQRKTLMWIAAGAMLTAFVIRCTTFDPDGFMGYFGYMTTFARMDSLAAGAFIALAARGPGGIQALKKPATYGAIIAGLAITIILGWRQTHDYSDPVLGTVGISVLWAFFGSLLVLALTWKPAEIISTQPVLRWFGKYSYGMYVWHPIIIIIFVHTNWARSWRTGNEALDMVMQLGIALAIVFAVTLLSWHLMEKQFLKLKRYFD